MGWDEYDAYPPEVSVKPDQLDSVGRFCLGAAATLVGGAVVAVVTQAVPVGPWAWPVVVLVVGLLTTALVSYWHQRGDNFPQWFFDDEPYGVVIQVAQSADQYGTDPFTQGLHLTAKNRPWHDRKTKPARDAWIHAIFDGGVTGMKFEPQLLWSAGRSGWPPPKIIDLIPNDRVYIPIAFKKFNGDQTGDKFTDALQAGTTYLMDEQFHHRNPKVATDLKPTDYNIAIWIEYDGGRRTKRNHFVLKVRKDATEPNELVRATD